MTVPTATTGFECLPVPVDRYGQVEGLFLRRASLQVKLKRNKRFLFERQGT